MAALFNLLSNDRTIRDALRSRVDAFDEPSTVVRELIGAGLDALPLPGHGATRERWRALADVAGFDLATAKLFESHTDALAILKEIDTHAGARPSLLYAVWASEAPSAPLRIRPTRAHGSRDDRVLLDGSKAWCSGARSVDVGLVTAVDDERRRWLVEVDLDRPGITIDESRWQAVGMADTGTADISFDAVDGRIVGASNAYLERPGFWHGGGGIAACWFGAAAAIGRRVRDLQAGRTDVHARAHLATIDARLAAAAALLRECASSIDAHPARDVRRDVLRVRAAVVDASEHVLREAQHALGPGPFCTDRRLARHAADLPVFLRQMRAEHDLVAQAEALLATDGTTSDGWTL